MFEAQYLHTKLTAGVSVFGPWMPRQTDNIEITMDLIQAEGAEIKVELIHKNNDDTGDGTTVAGTITRTGTTGRHDAEVSALMELVRYKYTVYSADAGVPGFVLFRMLSPIWFDSVDG